jgi:uncharacterized protein YndB with AHSA1/START domain
MFEIFHELPINTSAALIYRAITVQELISNWWLPNAKIKSVVGEIGIFPLSDGENRIVIEVAELIPNQRVVWKCLEHKFPEWTNTIISFEIQAGDSAPALLCFTHAGWLGKSGVFGKTSYYWAALYLKQLKEMLERR